MDENYDRNFKANEYLDRKAGESAEKAEDIIIEGLVKMILFATGCVCGAIFF